MAATKGKRVALWAGAAAIVVLGATTFALKDRVAEEYWLHRLEHGDEGEWSAAARALAERRSTRAVPLLLRRAQEAVWRPSRIGQTAAQQSLVRIGRPAVRLLVDCLDDPDSRFAFLALTTLCDIYGPPFRKTPAEWHAKWCSMALDAEALRPGPILGDDLQPLEATEGSGLETVDPYRSFLLDRGRAVSVVPLLEALAKGADESDDVRRAAAATLKRIEVELAKAPR